MTSITNRPTRRRTDPPTPKLTVQLSHLDNAFAMLGRCKRRLEQAGQPPDVVARFLREARSKDFEHLLRTIHRWFEVR